MDRILRRWSTRQGINFRPPPHVLRRWSTRQGINFQAPPPARTLSLEYEARAWFAKGAILGPFLDEIGCSWTRLKPQTPPRTPTTEYAAGFGISEGPRFQTFVKGGSLGAREAWFAKRAILGPFLDKIGCSWTRLKPQIPPRTPTTEYAGGY